MTRRLPDTYVSNPYAPGMPGRPSPAGQLVLSGRASAEVAGGAVPVATDQLPDGMWCVVERTETHHYRDEHGVDRHYSTDARYILVGVDPGPTIAETAVAEAAEESGLSAIARELEEAGALRPATPREQWTRHEVPGRDLFEHLVLQSQSLHGGWVRRPDPPAWLTEWLATDRAALTTVDAGGTIRLRARRR